MVAKYSSVASVWVHRCLSERAAAAQYASLASALEKVRPDSDFVGALLAASEDERRHAQLCLQQAQALGFSGALETPPAFESPADSKLSFEAITRRVAITIAIGESLNAVLLQTELEQSTNTRALLRSLLKDEVQHARLGWQFLTEAASLMELGFLRRPLTLALRSAEAELLKHSAPAASPLSDSIRIELWRETLRTVIFPGLASCGVTIFPSTLRVAEV